MKTRKSNVSKVEVNVNEVNATKYNCNMFVSQEVNAHVIIVDMSKAVLCDYMKMSRIAMFRLLVKKNCSFDVIAKHDFLFYRDTNDRSKSKSADKRSDLLAYCRSNRTRKQLADVLKEKDIVSFLSAKYNVNSYLTVDQYVKTVK